MSLDVCLYAVREVEVYSANITHNLNDMAREVGLYQALWRPEEIGITHARQLIPLLNEGVDRLLAERERLQAFSPSNGWGSYKGLLSFVCAYRQACEDNPDAKVEASR